MNQDDINSIDDLLASESFRKWILDKDEQEGIFWTHWIEQHPARIEWVAAAKAIIATLTQQTVPLSQQEIDTEAAGIQEKIATGYEPVEDAAEEELHTSHPALWIRMKWAAGVAAALVLAISGIYLYVYQTRPHEPANAWARFRQETKNKSVEYNNNSDTAQRIALSDGSEVVLEKNSRLHYAAGFTSGKREVYLTGTALFNIARNPSRPFIVYTQSIVTKVLGTSFTVHAPAGAAIATVLVKTGRVSVFKRAHFTNTAAGSATLKGMVLTTNQQVVYDIGDEQMSRSLAPAPTLAKAVPYSFDFEDRPATEVFARLQEAYGITILMDEEALASCMVTAALANKPFYEKLRIICKIINAGWQEMDGYIIINVNA